MAESHLQKRKHDQMIKLKGMYDRQLKIYEEQKDKGRLYPKGNPIFPRKTARYEEWLKSKEGQQDEIQIPRQTYFGNVI